MATSIDRTPLIPHRQPPSHLTERLIFGTTTLLGVGGVTVTVAKATLSPPFTFLHGVALFFSGLSITSGVYGFWNTRRVQLLQWKLLYHDLKQIEAALDPLLEPYLETESEKPQNRQISDVEKGVINAQVIDSLRRQILEKIDFLKASISDEQDSYDEALQTIERLREQLNGTLTPRQNYEAATTLDPEVIRKALEDAAQVAQEGERFRRRISFGGTPTPPSATSSPKSLTRGRHSSPLSPSKFASSSLTRTH